MASWGSAVLAAQKERQRQGQFKRLSVVEWHVINEKFTELGHGLKCVTHTGRYKLTLPWSFSYFRLSVAKRSPIKATTETG